MTLKEKIHSIEKDFTFFRQLLDGLSETTAVYIDLFCGAGGVTSGIERSAGASVIFAVNHDALAIESHHANHELVIHAVEDIRNMDLSVLVTIVEIIREIYPEITICLWASLECTHFSKAKGGDSRDADSRTLAEHLYRYIIAIGPDYIDIENVVEFMSWGPLRIKCKKQYKDRSELLTKEEDNKIISYSWIPYSRKNGRDYSRWCKHICEQYGYEYDYRILNAADFGARTSRIRYFGQFKKPYFPFTWPDPTHAKLPGKDGIFNSLLPWRPVKPALDLEDEGNSIFGRKKDLSPNTYKRIYAGLIKYVGTGKEPEFISKYLSNNAKTGVSNPVDLNDPAPTLTTQNRLAYVKAQGSKEFIAKYFSGRPKGKVKSVDETSGTITTFGGGALVTPEFLQKYYGNGDNHSDIDHPSGTITTKDRFAVVNAVWLDKQFRSDKNHQSIDKPAGSILTNDKHSKITAIAQPEGWLMNHNYDNNGSSLDIPSPTLLASRKHYYLLNPQFSSAGKDIDSPCFTLIARMDKRPPSLIEAETGNAIIVIYDTDIDIMVKIKLFMAAYGIVDIKMRMLKVKELLKIQGFDDEYILKGNQSDQKKFIGNSVPPELVEAKVNARVQILKESMKVKKPA